MSASIEGKEFWLEQLEKLKASGKPRSLYCRENNINYDRFGYWLKRLASTTSEFVPIKLASPQPIPSHITLCTIEFRGHVLKIHDLSALSFVLDRLS